MTKVTFQGETSIRNNQTPQQPITQSRQRGAQTTPVHLHWCGAYPPKLQMMSHETLRRVVRQRWQALLATYRPSCELTRRCSEIGFIFLPFPRRFAIVSIVSLLLDHGNLTFEPVHVLTFFSSDFAFLIEMNFSFKSLFTIWSLSQRQFHYHFD